MLLHTHRTFRCRNTSIQSKRGQLCTWPANWAECIVFSSANFSWFLVKIETFYLLYSLLLIFLYLLFYRHLYYCLLFVFLSLLLFVCVAGFACVHRLLSPWSRCLLFRPHGYQHCAPTSLPLNYPKVGKYIYMWVWSFL